MTRCQKERDRLEQQNITLMAIKTNLKGELSRYDQSRFDQCRHDVDSLKELAAELRKSLAMKATEVEGLEKEKEMMTQEIKDLQNEITAHKVEVS